MIAVIGYSCGLVPGGDFPICQDFRWSHKTPNQRPPLPPAIHSSTMQKKINRKQTTKRYADSSLG